MALTAPSASPTGTPRPATSALCKPETLDVDTRFCTSDKLGITILPAPPATMPLRLYTVLPN